MAIPPLHFPGALWPLWQSPAGGVGQMVWWLVALVLVVIVALWGVTHLKRRLKVADEPTVRSGFTLGDLRDMHRQGQITDEEFEKTKAQVVAAAQRAAARAAATPPVKGTFEVLEPKPRADRRGLRDDDAELE